ncbi:MAG: DUF5686 family protein [Calditrichia bacterium]
MYKGIAVVMRKRFFTLSFFLLGCLSGSLFGQKIIHGVIRDAESRDFLPAANIQIEGTFKGTITNENGEYILKLDELPAALLVSYIGYASQRIPISRNSADRQDILLTPVAYELEPIVVTGEDPAIRIMREVIRRKQQWRAGLKTYSAEAYTRMVLENDTSITSIMESISTAYWDKKRGTREMVSSRRQTSNMSSNENFAAVGQITNMYDDDVEIGGFRVVGVTHPDALDYYDFKLEGQRQLDNKIVYDISVWPKSKLQPAFMGRIAVLDSMFAMIQVDLKPGKAVLFPPPIQEWNLEYKQQFSNFGKEYWLPVDIHTSGSIKIGFIGLQFPLIKISSISRLSDYKINIALPDSLYKSKEEVLTDSSRIQENPDSVFTQNPEVVPFSGEEKTAYSRLDSTMTLEKAYKPTGALARFVTVESDHNNGKNGQKSRKTILSDISPILGYNRVDEATLGIEKSFEFPANWKVNIYGGYKTGIQRGFFGGEVQKQIGKKKSWRAGLKYSRNTDTRYTSVHYPQLFNSFQTLLGYDDYFDYYWNEKFAASLGYSISPLRSAITVSFHDEMQHSLGKTTDYNLLGRTVVQRDNPAVPEGRLRSFELRLVTGDDFIPFGVIGQNHLEVSIEHSSPDILSSDFDFMCYRMALDLRIPTFLRRRLLPNVLDLRLVAGTAQGNLPPQRFGILDGALQIFSPFGVFKSLTDQPYEGEKYAGIFWEHNFRTVPLEILGLRSLAQKGIGIILHGASGRTWISDRTLNRLTYTPRAANEFHHELGISVNGLFGLFRVDFTRRLDEPGYFLGFSLARLF